MEIGNYKKSHINNNDIKANILSYLILRIDYKGLLSIDNFIEDFHSYLGEEGFVAEKDLLSIDDIEIIDETNVFYKFLEKETVVRFKKNDNATRIVVTRHFTYIFLDYTTSHKLEENIIIFNDLVNIMHQKVGDYIIFKEISLKKNNSVIIGTMKKILDCFDTRLFNEPSMEINRLDKRSKANLLASKSENIFTWDQMLFKAGRKISEGFTNFGENSKRKCYEVILDIEGTLSFDNIDEEETKEINEVKPIVEKINSGIFEIFKLYMSVSFLNDMVRGESKRVLKGLNRNE